MHCLYNLKQLHIHDDYQRIYRKFLSSDIDISTKKYHVFAPMGRFQLDISASFRELFSEETEH